MKHFGSEGLLPVRSFSVWALFSWPDRLPVITANADTQRILFSNGLHAKRGLIWNDFEWSLVTARLLRLKRIWVIREMDEYLLSVSKSATAEPVYSETASAAKGYWHLRQLHSTPTAVSGSDHTGNYIKSFDALIPMKETPPHAR